MRVTVRLDDDVASEVDRLRREEGLSLTAAVNRLARLGAGRGSPHHRYSVRSRPLGVKVDAMCIGETLALLDEVEGVSTP